MTTQSEWLVLIIDLTYGNLLGTRAAQRVLWLLNTNITAFTPTEMLGELNKTNESKHTMHCSARPHPIVLYNIITNTTRPTARKAITFGVVFRSHEPRPSRSLISATSFLLSSGLPSGRSHVCLTYVSCWQFTRHLGSNSASAPEPGGRQFTPGRAEVRCLCRLDCARVRRWTEVEWEEHASCEDWEILAARDLSVSSGPRIREWPNQFRWLCRYSLAASRCPVFGVG